MSARILAIAPVAGLDDGILQEEAAYMRSFLAPDIALDYVCLQNGPAHIVTADDERACLAEVKKIAQGAQDIGYACVLVNCFDEPGVADARSALTIPVVGCLAPALKAASEYGRFAVLTDEDANVAHCREQCAEYKPFVRALGIPVAELASSAALPDTIVRAIAGLLAASPLRAAVLGCTDMFRAAAPARKRLGSIGVRIIEPLSEAVRAACDILSGDA